VLQQLQLGMLVCLFVVFQMINLDFPTAMCLLFFGDWNLHNYCVTMFCLKQYVNIYTYAFAFELFDAKDSDNRLIFTIFFNI
jgi:hypothetical protein